MVEDVWCKCVCGKVLFTGCPKVRIEFLWISSFLKKNVITFLIASEIFFSSVWMETFQIFKGPIENTFGLWDTLISMFSPYKLFYFFFFPSLSFLAHLNDTWTLVKKIGTEKQEEKLQKIGDRKASKIRLRFRQKHKSHENKEKRDRNKNRQSK